MFNNEHYANKRRIKGNQKSFEKNFELEIPIK